MPTTSYTARMVMAVIALHLIGFHSLPIYAENLAASGREADPVAETLEPAVLKTIAAAEWSLAHDPPPRLLALSK